VVGTVRPHARGLQCVWTPQTPWKPAPRMLCHLTARLCEATAARLNGALKHKLARDAKTCHTKALCCSHTSLSRACALSVCLGAEGGFGLGHWGWDRWHYHSDLLAHIIHRRSAPQHTVCHMTRLPVLESHDCDTSASRYLHQRNRVRTCEHTHTQRLCEGEPYRQAGQSDMLTCRERKAACVLEHETFEDSSSAALAGRARSDVCYRWRRQRRYGRWCAAPARYRLWLLASGSARKHALGHETHPLGLDQTPSERRPGAAWLRMDPLCVDSVVDQRRNACSRLPRACCP